MKTGAGLAVIVLAFVACAGQAAAQAGHRAWVDPATGVLGPPPQGSSPPSSVSRAASPALVEQPGTTPAGGVMLDLGESLMYGHQARLGADGELKAACAQQPE